MTPRGPVTQPDYQAMADFRYHIRRFLRFSESAARHAGLEPQQYLMLLALKGLPGGHRGRIGEVAERLQIQHHSTVELVDRLEKRGMVRRRRGDTDRREVMLELTPRGEKVLRDLALYHREELREVAPALVRSLKKAVAEARHPARAARNHHRS